MKATQRKTRIRIGLLALLIFGALVSFRASGQETDVVQAATTEGYVLWFNSREVTNASVKLEEMNGLLEVRQKNDTEGIDTSAVIEFTSSNENVVVVENTSSNTIKKIVRKGPGYATIIATITVDGTTQSLSCIVTVGLKITDENHTTITNTGSKGVILNQVGDKKQVFLKYIGDDMSISGELVNWSSSNPLVATVSENGEVTAVGSGMTTITAETITGASESISMSAKTTVFVAPIGSFTQSADYTGYADRISAEIKKDNFMLYVNNTSAENLVWRVYRKVSRSGAWVEELVSPDSNLLNYTVNEYSGSVSFTNVKAGTYIIRAYTGANYVANGLVPYFEAKVVVLFALEEETSLIMNVGDRYDIVKNTNISDVGLFDYATDNSSVASVKNGVITANSSGTADITMVYKGNLFEDGDGGAYDGGVEDRTIHITVIDGISLNYSEVTIFTSGTLQLQPIVSDRVAQVSWSSSNAAVAKVDEEGLVTGVKAGTAVIYASQTINGITKTASCTVYVQQSVTSITLDPSEMTLGIDKYAVIQALVKPSALNGLSLKWASSDEKIVEITETGNLSVTIRGVKGGTAVITAINQENVVVGFCNVTVVEPVSGMTLSESEVTANIGDKVQLRATIKPDNASDQSVTWKSSDEKVATVSTNGLVTMKAAGTVSIICISNDNPAVQAYCKITVRKPVSGVSLDVHSKEMYVGENYRLTYLVTPSTATIPDVLWSSINSSVADVDDTGMVTAKGVGQTEILIQTVDGSYLDICTIVVKQKPTNVKIAVSNLIMNAGEYFYMDVVLTPANSTSAGLTWECVDTSVATVSQTGKITAKKAGKTIVMVKAENGATSYCNLTVLEAVTGLTVTPAKTELEVGETLELVTEFTPATASNTTVTWSSSDEAVATVDEKGKVTGIAGGIAVITCEAEDGGYNAVCIVAVQEAITSIKITPEQYKLGLGKTYQLTAEISNPTASNKEMEWKSSDESVVSVTKNGKIKGLKLGYATITVSALDGSGAEATCEIRVVREVTGISLNYTTKTLVQGDTMALKATITPSNSTYKKANWSSDNPEVVMVDDSGVITAISPGTAWITASARDESGKYAKCYVTVIPLIPATGITTLESEVVMAPGEKKTVVVKATPANSTDNLTWSSQDESIAKVNEKTGDITAVSPGQTTVTVMADSGKKATIKVIVVGLSKTSLTMKYYSGSVQLYVEGTTSSVRWYSSDESVAVVSANGTVTSRGIGTAKIEARVNGRTLVCTVTVVGY